MSRTRPVKPFRMRAADKLAAERVRAAQPVGMATVIDRLALLADVGEPLAQLPLGGGVRPNNMTPPKYIDPCVDEGSPVAESSPIRVLYRGIDSIGLNI